MGIGEGAAILRETVLSLLQVTGALMRSVKGTASRRAVLALDWPARRLGDGYDRMGYGCAPVLADMRYDICMDDLSRRGMIGLTTAAVLAPLDVFSQRSDRIPAEIEAKIPPAASIDKIVRDYVRESKGK